MSFVEDLQVLINRHSKENGSNTPDFILAEYLNDCLAAFERTSRRRESWFGKSLYIGMGQDCGPGPARPSEEGEPTP